MTATDAARGPAPAGLAALNAQERAILRLLAAGHTTKTIAAQLGRSETAITERLRAARRKTGIGSSRELARLLEAQENCDRKIGLPAAAAPDKPAPSPASRGTDWTKGRIAMLLALPVAAAGLILAAASATSEPADTAARPSPLVGTWALDVSRIPAAERPARVTIRFGKAADGKWTTQVDVVGPDGTASHAESTAATDGVPVPIGGTMHAIDTAALRQPAPNTLVLTLARRGTPVSTRVYAVAKDRKTMTETIVWAGSSVPKLETTYFNRVE